MRDTPSIVLVLLIANTSLNRGEKLKIGGRTGSMGIISPPRVGRSSGMTDFARINRVIGEVDRYAEGEDSSDVSPDRESSLGYTGPKPGSSSGRSSEMTAFTRINRAAGLMAFPRIGRSDRTEYDVGLDLNYEDLSHEMKRQGMIPFPRVGRSREASLNFGSDIVKIPAIIHEGVSPVGAMWFGPRLGRLHRRSDDGQSDDQQWSLLPVRDYQSQGSQGDNFGKKLGRDSDTDEPLSTFNAVVY